MMILSPDLFGFYGEQTMRDDDIDIDVNIRGRLINNLRYADDTTLAATNKNYIERILGKVQTASKKAGLLFNIKKTKVMSTGQLDEFNLDGEAAIAKETMNDLSSIMQGSSFSSFLVWL